MLPRNLITQAFKGKITKLSLPGMGKSVWGKNGGYDRGKRTLRAHYDRGRVHAGRLSRGQGEETSGHLIMIALVLWHGDQG